MLKTAREKVNFPTLLEIRKHFSKFREFALAHSQSLVQSPQSRNGRPKKLSKALPLVKVSLSLSPPKSQCYQPQQV